MSLRPTLLVLGLAACQEPFGTDRHSLEADRIAAVTSSTDGATTSLRAVLVVDGHLWTDDPVDLRWFRTEARTASELAALDPEAPPDAVGPAPTLATEAGRVAVIATFPSGTERRAFLDLSASPPATRAGAIEVAGLDLRIDDLQDGDLDLAVRRDLEPTSTTWVPSGGFARLSVELEGAGDEPVVRWMATAPHGTFLELTRTSADWAAALLVLDDEEIDSREPIGQGPVSVLALWIDGVGVNGFDLADLWVGQPELGVFTATGSWLPADAVVSGPANGTLVRDDAAPGGLRLEGLATGLLAGADPYGTSALSCAAVEGPFDPIWLADGRCSRTDLAGATVGLELR